MIDIHVTKPMKPPLTEYMSYLADIWERGHFTNHGPLCLELEEKIKDYLEAEHFLYVSNGTLALQLALKALGKTGEVITTPFSFVATTSSIVWEGLVPVFVDIEPHHLTLDPAKIESAITEKTVAILATHVFGNPCDVEKIEEVARKHQLVVIYDGAHSFGVRYKGKPLTQYGDMTTLSFHATKLFHTVEGGGVVTENADFAKSTASMRSFGMEGSEVIKGLGINAKNSEVHAAMGLCNLPRVKNAIQRRKYISDLYDFYLTVGKGALSRPLIRSGTDYNYAYYPVLFDSESALIQAKSILNSEGIYPRRYFYPALNGICYVDHSPMPIAEDISRRVLCLPLFDEMSEPLVERISHALCSILRQEVA
jgi:dTDP-4-amino-4,6-dideoxygalactose transaminase